MRKLIIIIVMLILTAPCQAEQKRRLLSTNANGTHHLMPSVGEQLWDTGLFVQTEKYIRQWDGEKIIHQWLVDSNGNCQMIAVWKPIIDPTYGTFYGLIEKRECKGSI
jgi:hypothetical protein